MTPTAILPDATERIAQVLSERDATIPQEWRLPKSFQIPQNTTSILRTSGLLSDLELELIDLSAVQLAKAIAEGRYTAVQATIAYGKAGALAQQATNCLVEMFMPEALERARRLDEILAATGHVVGPLHGVPVSIKDHMDIKGHESPSGFLCCVGESMADEDAHAVGILRDAGAVFYCKTTNPQSIMHLESSGYWGATTNPHNSKLTCGGSSGGEGAILGFKGSPFGLGSDIGGSLRSPAANCGIYTFKPTAGRLPKGGMRSPARKGGYEGILVTHGPMGRHIDDLGMYMRLILATEPWRTDPRVLHMPWRDVVLPRKLRVGVLRDDGVVRPVKPIRRAIEHVVAKLEKDERFEVVEYAPYKDKEAWDILRRLYWPDGGKSVRALLDRSGEPIRPMTEWIISQSEGKEMDLAEYYSFVNKRDEFRLEVAKHWQSQGVDVVLAPVGPTPAPLLETAKYWGYTSYWNLVNYPAGVFPTGLSVTTGLDREDPQELYHPRSQTEAYILDTYASTTHVDAPICLQVVGYIGYDEETLAAMERIVEAVGAPQV